MAQNGCSQDAAFGVLRNASGARNVKLREVAAAVVAGLNEGRAIETRFDE
jgi:AmiR/NasT family two-component response regulator